MAESGLKLRIQVLLPVLLVHERMNAVAIVSVVVQKVKFDGVAAFLQSLGQENHPIVKVRLIFFCNLLIVDRQMADGRADEVQEKCIVLLRQISCHVESYDCFAKVGFPFWEGHGKLVLDIGNQLFSPQCLIQSELVAFSRVLQASGLIVFS